MSDKTIDFASLATPAATTTPAAPTPAPVSSEVKTAETVATAATVVAETVAPGVSQAPIESGAEQTTLALEESVRRLSSVIPGFGAVSGFVLPAEIVTHLAFAFVSLFKHHVKTVQAQQQAQPKQ